MQERTGGVGGAIGLTAQGEVGTGFTTPRMAWAFIKDSNLRFGLNPGEKKSEKVRI